jgi:hypothetical protein
LVFFGNVLNGVASGSPSNYHAAALMQMKIRPRYIASSRRGRERSQRRRYETAQECVLAAPFESP